METKDSIQDKLKKLIRMRDSAEEIGNLEEAESFAEKIQEMAIKYGVEITKLDTSEQEVINAPADRRIDLVPLMKRHESDWIMKLFSATSVGNMCKFVICNSARTEVHIFGFEHNIEIAIHMAEQLIPKFRQLARKDFKSYDGHEKRNTYIRGWLQGAAQAIRERLVVKLDEAKIKNSDVRALVTTTETKIAEHLKSVYPRLGVARDRKLQSVGGRAQGYATGKSMSINKGVSGGSSSSRLLN